MSDTHEFALYVPNLSSFTVDDTILLTDHALVTRIYGVLRLQPGERCILFDERTEIRCTVKSCDKKRVLLSVRAQKKIMPLQPKVHCLLPLLKRDDLEAALYASVELGATDVQLVLTDKVQRAWAGTKEFERLHRIMVAAAEQSKHFALPKLHGPRPLLECLHEMHGAYTKIFFDASGVAAPQLMRDLVAQQPKEVVLLVGPEGDLTDAEKVAVEQHQFVKCALTPTVLRAVSAYALGLGLVRSCLSDE